MSAEPSHNPARRFLRTLWGTVSVLVLLMLALNYLTDRYYVFHPRSDAFEEVLEPNTRVLKAAYLEDHCASFDSVILGSSRAAVYRTGDLERTFGGRAFNFGVATGSLPDILDRLEWLDSLGCLPRRIYLPLSIDRLRFANRPNDLLRKEYPAIVGEAGYRREFLLTYLGIDAFFSNLRAVWEKQVKRPEARFRYDLSSGDVDYLWDRELEFPQCPDREVRTDPVTLDRFADYLARIEGLAASRDSELVLFWNPIPLADQLARVEDAGALFRRIGGKPEAIYRVPLTDPRLIDGDAFHDKGHFKAELAASVYESPENRVPLNRLLDELVEARSRCPHAGSSGQSASDS